MEPSASVSLESPVVYLTKKFLIPILIATCVLLALKNLMGWLRKYLMLRKLPGPDDTFPPAFMCKALWEGRFNVAAEDAIFAFTAGVRETIDKYSVGGVCKFYAGFMPVVILSKAEAAEALLTDSVNLGRPRVYLFLEKFMPNNLLTATGGLWRFQRTLFMPAARVTLVNNFVGIFNNRAMEFCSYLSKLPQNEEIKLFRETSKCTMNVIAEASTGFHVDALAGNNPYGRALNLLQRLVLLRLSRPWMWIDWFYYGFTHDGAVMKGIIKKMRGLTGGILKAREEKHREAGEKAQTDEGASAPQEASLAVTGAKRPRVFLDLLIETFNVYRDFLPKHWVQNSVDSVMFAGQDTTASALSWTLYILGHHPEVQDKCREEMDNFLGSDPSTFITSDHLKSLKYLQAAIKEAMRVYSPVPVVGRLLETDIEVKVNGETHKIPRGVEVFLSLFHLQRDPRYFPDPEKYDPGRFLDENAPHKKHLYSYAPFSAGPRSCVGQKFALTETKVIVAHILRNFKWTSCTPRDKLVLAWEVVMRNKGDLPIRLEPLHPIKE